MKNSCFIAILVLLVSCSSQPELSGSVAVSGANSESISLEAVEIRLIPEKGFRKYSELKKQSLEAGLRAASDRWKECSQYLRQLSSTLPDIKLKLKQCEREYLLKQTETMEGFFKNLPGAAATSTADSGGKFSLNSPNGKYVIAAKGRRWKGVRKMIEPAENYYWFTPVEIKEHKNTIILNNSNMYRAAL